MSYLGWGAGPRASQALILAAKAAAVLEGSTHATPDHVRAVAKPVLRHRIITNFNAEADAVTTDHVVESLLQTTPEDGATPQQRDQMNTVMR
jgi:MoxR-like ATPase